MTGRERNALLMGLLIGALVAAAIFAGRQYLVSRSQPGAVAASPSMDQPVSQPEVASNPDSAAAIQLTEEDQKAIGIETVEVKRETIRRAIAAPGKVAEPETGVGTISARIGGRIEKLLIRVTGEPVSR